MESGAKFAYDVSEHPITCRKHNFYKFPNPFKGTTVIK